MTRSPVPRISASELAERLSSGDALTVLDVRGRSYRTSESKIAGAVRIDPKELAERHTALPHDRTVVAYCT